MDRLVLTDEQSAENAPHLPEDTPGNECAEYRQVTSGIVHMLKSGGLWTKASYGAEGPKKVIFNRYALLCYHGRLDRAVRDARQNRCPFGALVDFAVVKAHGCFARAKRGKRN